MTVLPPDPSALGPGRAGPPAPGQVPPAGLAPDATGYPPPRRRRPRRGELVAALVVAVVLLVGSVGFAAAWATRTTPEAGLGVERSAPWLDRQGRRDDQNGQGRQDGRVPGGRVLPQHPRRPTPAPTAGGAFGG